LKTTHSKERKVTASSLSVIFANTSINSVTPLTKKQPGETCNALAIGSTTKL